MSTNISTYYMLIRKEYNANIKCMANAEITNQFKIKCNFPVLQLARGACLQRTQWLLLTATGDKVLLSSIRPHFIYVELDMKPGVHMVITFYYPQSPLSASLSNFSVSQDIHIIFWEQIEENECTCLLTTFEFYVEHFTHLKEIGNPGKTWCLFSSVDGKASTILSKYMQQQVELALCMPKWRLCCLSYGSLTKRYIKLSCSNVKDKSGDSWAMKTEQDGYVWQVSSWKWS